jgi:hypothetical protein
MRNNGRLTKTRARGRFRRLTPHRPDTSCHIRMTPYMSNVYKPALTMVATANTTGNGPPACALPEANIPATSPRNPGAATNLKKGPVLPRLMLDWELYKTKATLKIKEATNPIRNASRQWCETVTTPHFRKDMFCSARFLYFDSCSFALIRGLILLRVSAASAVEARQAALPAATPSARPLVLRRGV